jgi:predicted MarR family transcription regulator
LVGYWMSKMTSTGDAEVRITESAAVAGVQAARRRLGSLVHEPVLRDLSEVDRTFLAKMAVDDGPSRMADIAERMKVDANYVSQYRRRLIAADLIYRTGHGRVDYTLPHLREYLREHAASTGF